MACRGAILKHERIRNAVQAGGDRDMTIGAPAGFEVYNTDAERRGRIFVVSGPSGVGKGTVIAEVMKRVSGLALSVSATTREPRKGEVDGVHYHFMTEEAFKRGIRDGIFYEHAVFKERLYGTLKSTVERETAAGRDLVLEVDIQGARSVKKRARNPVLIYIQPPDFASLEERLWRRGTETEKTLAQRLNAAMEEQRSVKTEYRGHYVITNVHVDECASTLASIVVAERHRLLE